MPKLLGGIQLNIYKQNSLLLDPQRTSGVLIFQCYKMPQFFVICFLVKAKFLITFLQFCVQKEFFLTLELLKGKYI